MVNFLLMLLGKWDTFTQIYLKKNKAIGLNGLG